MPPAPKTTLDDSFGAASEHLRSKKPTPGLVLVFSVDSPRCDVLPLKDGELELGRGEVSGVPLDDLRMSRKHARVRLDNGEWVVEDLESRNGTSLDGVPLTGARAGAELRIVRTGSSVFLIQADVEPFRAGIATAGDTILGPTLARAWDAIDRAARSGTMLHITGESGTGKEHAARAFHALGPRRGGPYVAVNCAAIPDGLAERLLFGARKGAYSGAGADAEGYVQAAQGGVLFLDEVAELDLGVQAKLLRALETREVIPLGAARPVQVDFALVSATHKDLRAQVSAGRLREDLFFRIGRPAVRIPRLQERAEEIPWLVRAALRDAGATAGQDGAALVAHASLIEECLVRTWPGNVRELMAEIRAAAQEAQIAKSPVVQARHLSPSAGHAFAPTSSTSAADPSTSGSSERASRQSQAPSARTPRRAAALPTDEVIEEALRREGGNVARTARALGVHRTQLRRWLGRRGTGGTDDEEEDAEG
ncbi:sigma 54-interacting transcriptional regulator [Sorangium cellulosum]|uniref:sigma 54-interacting transcriptional regulator n=1 Tax=Sorangium cellulosum TaxID=56 RepID=UPI001F27904B|nr:sigma 54-interacting transcriptional regulator [Sorangium cellulosum]